MTVWVKLSYVNHNVFIIEMKCQGLGMYLLEGIYHSNSLICVILLIMSTLIVLVGFTSFMGCFGGVGLSLRLRLCLVKIPDNL